MEKAKYHKYALAIIVFFAIFLGASILLFDAKGNGAQGFLQAEIILTFMVIGFVTWYGTGLDDLLYMSVIFKEKSHDQKVVMFFGNLAAVVLIVAGAAYLAHFSENLKAYPILLKLPGLIPISIGFLEIRSLVRNKRRKKTIGRSKKKKTKRVRAFFLSPFFSMLSIARTILWSLHLFLLLTMKFTRLLPMESGLFSARQCRSI